jgi:hypothetical protein
MRPRLNAARKHIVDRSCRNAVLDSQRGLSNAAMLVASADHENLIAIKRCRAPLRLAHLAQILDLGADHQVRGAHTLRTMAAVHNDQPSRHHLSIGQHPTGNMRADHAPRPLVARPEESAVLVTVSPGASARPIPTRVLIRNDDHFGPEPQCVRRDAVGVGAAQGAERRARPPHGGRFATEGGAAVLTDTGDCGTLRGHADLHRCATLGAAPTAPEHSCAFIIAAGPGRTS